ncbi:MAG: crossover junction endodeoxyribonuclease RuvC [Gammaproteobacteria bacterium RIFCSPHIGHO2_12_FULL_38_11]|nr:MAG: crossover junction endodeoxyribonuclease RuvC [Gammaproteobacteria bacterium RIFCSPHIGHO2_12_FULL_38_11]
MTLIMGIDPGSLHTGFGIIKSEKQNLTHIAHGTINTKGNSMPKRLLHIYHELRDIIATHKPDTAAIEEVFMQVNVKSALKLGQARGVALVALAGFALPIAEYSPRVIKKFASGYGAASKEQMQFMVRTQLKLSVNPQADAADALAIAICHACHHSIQILPKS